MSPVVALFGRDVAGGGFGAALLGSSHDGPGFAGRGDVSLRTGRLTRIGAARNALRITGNRSLCSGGGALRTTRSGAGRAAFPRRGGGAARLLRPVGPVLPPALSFVMSGVARGPAR